MYTGKKIHRLWRWQHHQHQCNHWSSRRRRRSSYHRRRPRRRSPYCRRRGSPYHRRHHSNGRRALFSNIPLLQLYISGPTSVARHISAKFFCCTVWRWYGLPPRESCGFTNVGNRCMMSSRVQFIPSTNYSRNTFRSGSRFLYSSEKSRHSRRSVSSPFHKKT